MSKLKSDLSRYIDAGFPILYLNLFEEAKADEIIKEIADRRVIVEWNATRGYSEYDTVNKAYKIPWTDETIEQVFLTRTANDCKDLNHTLFVIKDIHTVFENKKNIAALKEIALKISTGLECTIILMSQIIEILVELEKYITILEMDVFAYDEIREIISDFVDEHDLSSAPALIDEMAMSFKGLTEFEIRKILDLAYADGGELTRSDLSLIFEQKQQMIKKSGIIEMIPVKESIDDIGGLDNLKNWLKKKAAIIKDINNAEIFCVDVPKGVLITGVPGCGKSLNAKAAAKLFDIPLLLLDMGRIMGKYVGESESNMRKAIALAEAIAPCVLWIDELEKAFAGIGGEGGGAEVTTRLLGTFLTWMQEKTAPVFVVATANDIVKLPPELLRKGRFDEIFYVGLPHDTERKKIFEIHIKKRRKSDLYLIDIDKLVEKTKGYSGADIEGVVREGVEDAFTNSKQKLSTNILLNVIKDTHSLSEIMKEPLEKMSKEYETRKFKNASYLGGING